jgi:exosortase F-associated protein
MHSLSSYRDYKFRASIILFCLLGLVAVFMFQQFSYAHLFYAEMAHPNLIFIVNKSTRLVLNDTLCLGLIYGIYYDIRYLKVGSLIQLSEMFILLPIYFYFKLTIEGDSEISSPLLSQIHRLIVNPTLMILLIIGFYYQLHANRQPRS